LAAAIKDAVPVRQEPGCCGNDSARRLIGVDDLFAINLVIFVFAWFGGQPAHLRATRGALFAIVVVDDGLK
jgi:hypothetical protein